MTEERSRKRGGCLLGSALLLLACREELADQNLSSEHFTVYPQGIQKPCEGILEELEAHRLAVTDWLGIPGPEHIHYYLYDDLEDLRANSPCGRQARCAGKSAGRLEVHTSFRQLDEHELLHAYVYDLSLPPPVLAEGLAVALECGSVPPLRPELSLSELLSQTAPYPDIRYYDAAGYLVRSLLDTFGKERVLQFYIAAGALSVTELPGELERFFGVSLEEIWERSASLDSWRVSACPCPLGGTKVGQKTSFDGSHQCGFLSRAVFEVTDKPVRVDVTGSRDLQVRAASCFADTWMPSRNSPLFESSKYISLEDLEPEKNPLPKLVYAHLEPGRYFLASVNFEPFSFEVAETASLGLDCARLRTDRLAPPVDLAVLWTRGEKPHLGLELTEPSRILRAGIHVAREWPSPVRRSCGAPESAGEEFLSWPVGEVWLGPLPSQEGHYSFEMTRGGG